MALCGAFGVLVECGESPTCQAHIQEQCSRVLDTMVQGADDFVMVLLTAYRSRCIPDIELSLVKIQQWLPKSNTAAEIAVGKYAPLSIDAVQQTSTMSQLDKRSLSAVCSVTGLAVEAMKAHPDQARLHTECFKCLRDLNHDTKVAISHAGHKKVHSGPEIFLAPSRWPSPF